MTERKELARRRTFAVAIILLAIVYIAGGIYIFTHLDLFGAVVVMVGLCCIVLPVILVVARFVLEGVLLIIFAGKTAADTIETRR